MISIITVCLVIITLIVLYNNREIVHRFFGGAWTVVRLIWFGICLIAFGTLIYGGIYFILFTLGVVK